MFHVSHRLGSAALLVATIMATLCSSTFADGNQPHIGKITGRSVLASVTSLIIWPGIGQAINDNPGEKVATHAVIGLLPPYRFWSAYDALVNRTGGYWKGRI